MSKVNFVSEFNSIMRYARDYSLSLRERMLWIALFYIANDRAVYNEQTQEYDCTGIPGRLTIFVHNKTPPQCEL